MNTCPQIQDMIDLYWMGLIGYPSFPPDVIWWFYFNCEGLA